ncbi:MAG: polynucleotide kinase-phosphatase [Lysinibacillus sp.]
MQLYLPQGAIVLCIGPSNSGKSTLLEKLMSEQQLLRSEVVGSDAYRELVSDIEYIDFSKVPREDQDVLYEDYQQISAEAFHVLQEVVTSRAKLNKVTFIDATHLRNVERTKYIGIAKKQHVPIIALVFDVPKDELLKRDEQRLQPRGKKRLEQQMRTFHYELRNIKKEPYSKLYMWRGEEMTIIRQPSPHLLDLGAGFDIIGDIHGCFDEMMALIHKLDYEKQGELYIHPQGRRLLSVGDIMSRGPKSMETMLFWLRQVEAGESFMVDSNHGWKIARWLQGQKVTLQHGDEHVAQEFEEYENTYGKEAAETLKKRFANMLLTSPSHYILTRNNIRKVVVVHAGISDRYIGKDSKRIRDFCRYGEVQGMDANGKPLRGDWFMDHKTSELIVWGHEPKPKPFKANRTINIDQGVVFGGQLTAFRYPEENFVAVDAQHNYTGDVDNPLTAAKDKRFAPPLAAHYVNGFTVHTATGEEVTIPKEKALAAMDTFSHYTLPPEQVLYIPPTMSPTPQTSASADYLEHPAEAFAYYRKHGVTQMIAEKKHMGSRAVIFIAKDEKVTKQLLNTDALGVITTRTGRAFFEGNLQQAVLKAIHRELIEKNYFERFQTDYVLMDAEILPWNLKAHGLIDTQYANVAEQALMDRQFLLNKLQATAHVDVSNWVEEYTHKVKNAARFDAVYQNYCWPTNNLNGIQIAPFHILAHSQSTHFDKPHTWHMEMNALLAENSTLFLATEYRLIETEQQEEEVINWWQDMTELGHEGIVIKPLNFIERRKGKLLQPAVKVRGREYLRIIYGMDYTDEAQLKALKKRNPSRKMRNALQEFILGMEGLERFVQQESSARVHECALATLALESEPVDPRL